MTREELIEKFNKQQGYIDLVDSYRLASIFTDLYGVIFYENLSIEDQLIVMWDKVKNYNHSQICKECNIEKDLDNFNIYHKGLSTTRYKRCKDCIYKRQLEIINLKKGKK